MSNQKPTSQSGQAVAALTSRVHQLLDEHKRLAEILKQTTEQLQQEQAQKRGLQEQLQSAQKEVERLQLVEGLEGGTTKSQSKAERNRAKARVNKLLREIDKCIALLNGA